MKHLLPCLVLISALSAFSDEISIGMPTYGGSGCPAGTASIALSPDSKSLSILFDSYAVKAGGATGQTLDRKNCALAAPVHVPAGKSIAIVGVKYNGFNSLPEGATSTVNVEYFFAGSRGPIFIKEFKGPLQGDYSLNPNLAGTPALAWSLCGQDTIVRINTDIVVKTNATSQEASASISQVGSPDGLNYFIQWRNCNSSL